MAKITRRGRNPGAVDSWLDNLGLYRKNVAYDETCLFRAVSEQLFDCQVYHERVRKECIVYARKNFEEFSYLANSFAAWQEHINLLEKHMVVCGNIEIHIISRKYSRDVIIFDAARQEIFQVTHNDFPASLRLCLMDEDHYDVVYNREHIMTAGFCQSVIYKVLYEKVFHIPNVDEIVKAMLYDKNNIVTHAELIAEKKMSEVNNNETGTAPPEDAGEGQLTLTNNNIAPFPFKVAKALDPTIYRNIEYDSWGEVRRELRLGEWYYGDDKLILGTRCILNDDITNEPQDCYIQEIIKDSNVCVVYLTKLAEKRTVNYSDLSPESDAKPWPLPYRFSKNLVIAGSPQVQPLEKTPRGTKKRNKEKRRTKSCSETGSTVPSETVENVSAYVGVPLQMHNPSESGYRENEASTETQTEPLLAEQMVTPNILNSSTRYQWGDQTHWHPLLPPTPDPMTWPQTPTTPQSMFNFNMKPMVASAPVTPDVVPYHDSNFPFYYNYQVDPFSPYGYWHQPPIELQPPQLKTEVEKPCEEQSSKPQTTKNKKDLNPFNENENIYEQPTISSPARPTLCTNLTPQSTPVEMYSPMMPLPPGTPVIYAPAPPEMTEMVVSSPPIIYSPPLDMQYLSPQFVYPPTPPAAWYPAGVNAHGFIFPRPQ